MFLHNSYEWQIRNTPTLNTDSSKRSKQCISRCSVLEETSQLHVRPNFKWPPCCAAVTATSRAVGRVCIFCSYCFWLACYWQWLTLLLVLMLKKTLSLYLRGSFSWCLFTCKLMGLVSYMMTEIQAVCFYLLKNAHGAIKSHSFHWSQTVKELPHFTWLFLNLLQTFKSLHL